MIWFCEIGDCKKENAYGMEPVQAYSRPYLRAALIPDVHITWQGTVTDNTSRFRNHTAQPT